MNSLTKTTYVDGTVFNSVRSSSSEITFDSIDESQWLVDFLLFDADMSRETEALAGSIDDYSRGLMIMFLSESVLIYSFCRCKWTK
jgi:hypothetical protein